MKNEIKTKDAPSAIGPYSQAIAVNGLVFLSGQIPVNPLDGEMPSGIEAQTKRVLENIAAILGAAGLTLGDVVKTTVFMRDLSEFAAMNAVYSSYFKPPYPSRSTVEVSALPKNALVEIESIAVKR